KNKVPTSPSSFLYIHCTFSPFLSSFHTKPISFQLISFCKMPSKRNMSSLILCLFAIFLFVFSAVASRELKDLSNRDRRAFNGDSRLFWGGGPNYFGGYGGGYFGPYDPRFGRYPFYGGGGLNNPYGGFNNPNIGFGGLNPFGGFGNPNIGFGNPNIGGGLGNPIGGGFNVGARVP
ncbi:hypothetical protein VIGAN_03069200, partial [Vigna angularis var. angularis]